MSMTREEAIERYEGIRHTVACFTGSKKDCDAVDMAFSALHPVSREQVEKMWRGEWLHDPETGYEHCDKCSHTISLDDYLNRKPPLFCEMCGDAKTDEAVEILLKRLEALYDTGD